MIAAELTPEQVQFNYGSKPEDCSECKYSRVEIDPYATGDRMYRLWNCEIGHKCPWGMDK